MCLLCSFWKGVLSFFLIFGAFFLFGQWLVNDKSLMSGWDKRFGHQCSRNVAFTLLACWLFSLPSLTIFQCATSKRLHWIGHPYENRHELTWLCMPVISSHFSWKTWLLFWTQWCIMLDFSLVHARWWCCCSCLLLLHFGDFLESILTVEMIIQICNGIYGSVFL